MMDILDRARLHPSKTDEWFAWRPVRTGALTDPELKKLESLIKRRHATPYKNGK